MVDIHQQVYGIVGLHHLEAVERSLLQVEWSYELILITIQLFFLHAADGHLHLHTVFGCLHDGISLCGKMHAELRMQVYHLLDTVGQLLCISSRGVSEQVRDIVNRRRRILQALEIDTRLSIRQRHTLK